MYAGLKIIDSHAHFPVGKDFLRYMISAEIYQEYQRLAAKQTSSKAQQQWRKAWNFSGAEEGEATDQELAARWIGELDQYGIDKIVWVTGGSNERLSEICRLYPDRFIGYAHHYLFAADAAEKLEKGITELGLKGYKLLAPLLDRPITAKAAYPVWEVCQKYNIPVLIHFGILGGGGGIAYNQNINPQILEPVAKEFPGINFIIPHFGCGYPRELLFLGWVCENIYVDTSGSNQWMHRMPYQVTIESSFKKFYETFGPERIIFGTDSSNFPRGFAIEYLHEQNKAVRFMNIPDQAAELIFSGNIARLLQLAK